MGVKATHHIAADLRALAMLRFRGQPLLPHGIEDAPLNRFEAVSNIRQRPTGDNAQRVVEIAGLREVMKAGALFRWSRRRFAPTSFSEWRPVAITGYF